MKSYCQSIFVLLLTASAFGAERPNILLVSIDDLNDWTGCLGGHPQPKTPNIDRLAERGTLFTNAHCQSPVCNPSRASLLTGRHPHTSGVYFLSPDLKQAPALKNLDTLPERFARHGYRTLAAGKIFHTGDKRFFQEYGGSMGGFGPRPKKKISQPHGHPVRSVNQALSHYRKGTLCHSKQLEAFPGKVDPAARYRCVAARV